MLSRESPERIPIALAGLRPPPLPRAEANPGVDGRPATVLEPVYIDPGRASRDGDRPPAGSGEEERGGGPEPLYFF
jgi:hypothetical protein